LRNDTQYFLDFGNNIFKRNSFLRDFAAASVAGIFLHPLHFAEARLVLQNRLPNFQSYKSLWTMFMSSYKEMYKGITAHIPRSFLLSLSKRITDNIDLAGFNYFSSVNIYTYLLQNFAFHSLAYPILTIQRRLECQTASRAGMLPLRYLGIIHCLGLMWREEGLKGFYRGYIAYLLAVNNKSI
jgi:Mitochondrial carrier protein